MPSSVPLPPEVRRAFTACSRLDDARLLSLADDLKASNPAFFRYAAGAGESQAGEEAAVRVAVFLEACYRERGAGSLPQFSGETVAAHHRETRQRFLELTQSSGRDPARAAALFLGDQARFQVTACAMELLNRAGVPVMAHGGDEGLMIRVFTLVSLYLIALPDAAG